jgi:serine protease Do
VNESQAVGGELVEPRTAWNLSSISHALLEGANMSNLLEQLNLELGQVVENARLSLVEVRNGRGGSGAGTIWHPEGLIITNAHVIRSRSPQVVLPDHTIRPARVLAYDSHSDVAALAVDAAGLPTIQLGESRNLRPGQWVMALGHPWGINGAVTGGVVIGAGRDLPEMPYSDREWVAVGLHLRPGHSGGPLVDAAGRLVGINTMMVGPEVGMAVPVHVVKAFLRRELGSPALR